MKQYLIGAGAVILLIASFFGGWYYQGNKVNNLGYREDTYELSVLTNTSTNYGWGTGQSVVFYRNLGITIGGTSSTGTFKLACSLSDTEPTWTGTKNATNTWDYVEMVDTQDGSSIDGDTGVSLVGTSDVRQFEANYNNFRWCNILATSTDSNLGTTIIKFKPADNQ